MCLIRDSKVYKLFEIKKWAKENNKNIDWTNIQERYDLYNEYFYSTVTIENEEES